MTAGPAVRPARRLFRRPKSWRFLRAALPFGVVGLIFVLTGVAWAVNHAGPSDSDYLEPGSTADIGAAGLAGELRAAGTNVRRYDNTPAATDAARGGDTTMLVTAPDYVYRSYLSDLVNLPAGDRVVLVAPSGGLLADDRLPLRADGSRWTTGVVAPDCALAEARAAGPAAVLGDRYRPTGSGVARCYRGGLLRLDPTATGGPEILVVGAGDVFRNDRIDEHGNRVLAGGLLAGRHSVAWLELHAPERPQPPPPVPTDQATPPAPEPSDGQNGGNGSDGSGGRGQGPGQDGNGSGSNGSPQPRSGQSNPLWGAFPTWLWAVVAQLLLAGVLLALWRARRLGGPVGEPLPVLVRSAETVTGRGRLYHRAGDRQAALDALRDGALRRLLPVLEHDLPAEPDPQSIVAALVARTGWPAERVGAVLYGPAPGDDEGLAAAANLLDALVRAAHG